MRRQRISAPARAQASAITGTCNHIVDDAPVVPVLNHVTDGATILDVHPESCIPLFLSRKLSENAVLRLAAIIDGTFDGSILTSIVSGAPTSILVPLVGELSHFLDAYLNDILEEGEQQSI